MIFKSNTYLLIFFLILLFFSGCSTYQKEKILNFFFDGVPPMEEKNIISNDTLLETDTLKAAISLAKVAEEDLFLHLPYLKKQCDDCHSQAFGELITPVPNVCYQCHSNFTDHQFVHGPVDGGNCLVCHSPHKSKKRKLIIIEEENICYKCHESSVVEANNYHDENSNNCTDCHDVHSGTNKYFIKDKSCKNCHQELTSSNKFVHGPLNVGYCGECHGSHQSNTLFNLKETGQNLCYKCHNSITISKNETHNEIGDTNCMECHAPHGSNDNYLLK